MYLRGCKINLWCSHWTSKNAKEQDDDDDDDDDENFHIFSYFTGHVEYYIP